MKRTLALLLCIFGWSMSLLAQSPVTITGTIPNTTSGTVGFKLTPWSDSVHSLVTFVGALPETQSCGINSSGKIVASSLSGPCRIYGNDIISPANTTYTVVFLLNGKTSVSVTNQRITGSTCSVSSSGSAPTAIACKNKS